MARDGIYFIGGASGAGKSRAAQRLAPAYSLPLIEIDDFQRLLIPSLPDLDRRIRVLRAVAAVLLEQLIQVRSSCIVEGSWLEPEAAQRLKLSSAGHFHPIFCGYSSEFLDARYESIQQAGEHWLSREQESFARAFLRKQVSDSLELARKCRKLDIEYVDFTRFTEGEVNLRRAFDAGRCRHGLEESA